MMETDVRNGQKMLEEHVAKTLLENNIEQRDTLNGMMKSIKVAKFDGLFDGLIEVISGF